MSLQYEVKIGNEVFNPKTLAFTLRRNEQLDYGQLIIYSDKERPYGQYEKVYIKIVDESNNQKNFCFYIYGDNVDICSYDKTMYTHTLAIIELTKKLDKIIGKNVVITQPLDPSKPKKTLWDVLQLVHDTIPFELKRLEWVSNNEQEEDLEIFNNTRMFKMPIDTSLVFKLKNTISPEYKMTGNTLREIINQIFSPLNAIARLGENGYLTCDFYNTINNGISLEDLKIIDYSSRSDGERFASNISSNVENMVSPYKEYIVEPNSKAFKPVETNQSNMIVGDKSSVFKTTFPIDNIISFKTMLRGSSANLTYYRYDTTNNQYKHSSVSDMVLDITPYIVEKDIFDTLTYEVPTDVTSKDFRGNVLYYSRGNNVIYNAGNTYDVFNTQLTMKNIVQRAVVELNQEIKDNDPTNEHPDYYEVPGGFDFKYYNFNSQIKYTPQLESKIENVKNDKDYVDKYSFTNTNQTERIVSSSEFSYNMYGLIQRLGNNVIKVPHNVVNLNDIREFGDYTSDNYIIDEIDFSFYTDYIKLSYQMTKNFNRISNFTNLYQENRRYEIPKSAVLSNLTYNEFIEVCDINDNEISDTKDYAKMFDNYFIYRFLNQFSKMDYSPLESCALITSETSSSYGQIGGYYFPLEMVIGGNQINFIMTYNSNVIANNKLVKAEDNKLIPDVYAQRGIKYTNEEGGLSYFSFIIVDGETEESGYLENYPFTNPYNHSYPANDYGDFKGVVGDSRYWFIYKKDSGEILNLNYAIKFYTLNNKVGLGKRLFENNSITMDDFTKEKLYIFQTDTPYSELENDLCKYDNQNTDIAELDCTVINTTRNEVAIKINNTLSKKYWAIGTGDRKMYLRGTKSTNNGIVFKHLNKKRGIKYEY